jgi:hypothetical protein
MNPFNILILGIVRKEMNLFLMIEKNSQILKTRIRVDPCSKELPIVHVLHSSDSTTVRYNSDSMNRLTFVIVDYNIHRDI